MKILITGSLGQLGSELVPALMKRYGENKIGRASCRERV